MRTGICPWCGSHQVYSGGQVSCSGTTVALQPRAGFLHDSQLARYICAVCGYTESYIADPNALREVVRSWDRVYPTPYR